ncbi:Mrp/NBP35 family ATP-binding protein [bacterium]|nr:Mrp/NBP35 family ATP-binding protein [bacterium]
MSDNMHVTEEQILEKLKTIKYPGLSRDIVSFGLIKGIEIADDAATIKVTVNTRDEEIPTQIEELVAEAVKQMGGLKEVRVEMTWTQPQAAQPHGHQQQAPDPIELDVKFKIAVASGKGGVGKSTVAAGLAMMLHKQGMKVGLVDFDVYGPSIPTLFGIHDRPLVKNNRIIPIEHKGIKLMSMGFLVEQGTPMIWRGPMVHQAVEQFLRDVEWGGLDILVVDLPPGTGDAQMTLSQKIKLDGAVIVSTPQNLALIDARKGVAMFQKMDVPILGIVENMSGFFCPNCNHETHIFGHGGAAAEAKKLGVPLLASLPLVPELVQASDDGHPLDTIESNERLAVAYTNMTNAVLNRMTVAVEPK